MPQHGGASRPYVRAGSAAGPPAVVCFADPTDP
jgi:hypothetical protein